MSQKGLVKGLAQAKDSGKFSDVFIDLRINSAPF